MQRARRFASVAVVASLAVAGLSACRVAPTVAAYSGDSTLIAESRVQAVFDEARKAFEATPKQPNADPQLPITKTDVLRALVSAQVLDAVAQKQSVAFPPNVDLADAETTTRIPRSAEYTKLWAHAYVLVSLLKQKAKDGPQPTDADLHDVYDGLITAKVLPPTQDFATFKSTISAENLQLVRSSLLVKNEITEVVKPMSLKINPRYQPLAISVLDAQAESGAVLPLITAPLGSNTESAPVVPVA